MQPQGHVQILVNMLDFGMNIQEAGDAARFLHDGGRQPSRSAIVPGHPLQGAPYGIYATADGHLALAMGSVPRLGELLGEHPGIVYMMILQ